MKKISILVLPALILFAAGCMQKKQADIQKPIQQVTQEVNQVNKKVEDIAVRLKKLEEEKVMADMLVAYGDYSPHSVPSDWSVYRNDEFDFELKHPSDWQAIEADTSKAKYPPDQDISLFMISNQGQLPTMKGLPKDFHVYGTAIMIFKGQNPNKLTTAEFFMQDTYTKMPADVAEKMQYIPYAVINGVEVYFQKTTLPSMPTVYFTHNTDLYMISDGIVFMSDAPSPVGQWDTVLSTFKFD